MTQKEQLLWYEEEAPYSSTLLLLLTVLLLCSKVRRGVIFKPKFYVWRGHLAGGESS